MRLRGKIRLPCVQYIERECHAIARVLPGRASCHRPRPAEFPLAARATSGNSRHRRRLGPHPGCRDTRARSRARLPQIDSRWLRRNRQRQLRRQPGIASVPAAARRAPDGRSAKAGHYAWPDPANSHRRHAARERRRRRHARIRAGCGGRRNRSSASRRAGRECHPGGRRCGGGLARAAAFPAPAPPGYRRLAGAGHHPG